MSYFGEDNIYWNIQNAKEDAEQRKKEALKQWIKEEKELFPEIPDKAFKKIKR